MTEEENMSYMEDDQEDHHSDSKDEKKEDLRTLFVSGFPPDVYERELKNMFAFAQGFEGFTVHFKGPAPILFVLFETKEHALRAKDVLENYKFDERDTWTLRAELAKTNLKNPGSKRSFEVRSTGQFQPDKRPRLRRDVEMTGRRDDRHETSSASGPTTLFVANLGPRPDDRELRSVFGRLYGYKRYNLTHKGPNTMAFVEFVDHRSAAEAMHNLHGLSLHSTARGGLHVEYARDSRAVPDHR
eukprot:TRINITY_DN15845_c0_g1::TRINITY_DN15845_c0_g1_i1::g.22500::m.22500 TRINITY_DN15845_c0_g1::TRINITY_DN15845_c0_g1_i1::g.22500  ORF type:complete len:263 (+),score=25.26,sp/Q9W6I1/RBPS2_CHICK/38.53/4e-14,RRM_1/PF00076.17/1.4e-06,RRM_1/PF00076.17/1.3e-07,RRM_6/PF14259.1/0.0037,RRM_6/PF14259.1/0.00024,RRM_5/PF13893.1/3.5,RRM_5/PF13893.1/0.0024 TRINITY_DN15845_c0_g1_i1:62-790(+)